MVALGRTTIEADVLDLRRLAVFVGNFLDLNSQLTGGRKDEDDGAVTGSQQWLGVDVDYSGQQVSECLAGASLRDTNAITSRKRNGPSLRLNGRGSSPQLARVISL